MNTRIYTITILMMSLVMGCTQPEKRCTISKRVFGYLNKQAIEEYTISNGRGMEFSVINYGGAITRLMVPDKKGKPGDVVLGYNSMEGYLQKNNPYFGCLVGRYANRISGARFMLNDTVYFTGANDHGNSLHGGFKGLDKVYWAITPLPGDSSLRLNYESPEGEEGYPGNLHIAVIYTLAKNNTLRIEYSATTDRPTPVNLTHHGYFNLSGGSDSTILGHRLKIYADNYTPVDSVLIPTGEILPVPAAMDFRRYNEIGRDISNVPGGYDHNYVLIKKTSGLEKAAVLQHPESGRKMEVWTTEPGLQFYSGNFLDGTLRYTKYGHGYPKYGALCLEAQHYPDSPNRPGFPSTILHPGERYQQVTEYRFKVE